uniref:Uncharacterized protein n=1 Tax=Arundo donax TaxID=35708 RepID=A0A0A8Y9V7_ARUDO
MGCVLAFPVITSLASFCTDC